MAQNEHGISVSHKLEGPTYQNGQWIARIELRGIEARTFQGMTQKEVQAQLLEYLDQMAVCQVLWKISQAGCSFSRRRHRELVKL